VTDASTARQLYDTLSVAAIVTIPADFDVLVLTGVRAPLLVQANNLNLDLTNDLRRAVPDAIGVYYEQQSPNPLDITVDEHNLRSQDIAIEQFSILPMLSLLILAHALISSGIATAREWEDRSIKELLLSPVSRAAIILGKVFAGFLSTCALSLVLFGLGYALGWTRPQGWYVGSVLLTIVLMSLFASALGIAIGSALRRVQSVTSLATTCSVWLFFLSGGIGVIQFEPDWLKQIAAFDPLTYGTHALQMATFYSSSDFLVRDLVVLSGATFLVLVLAWAFMKRGMAQ
jgi:ABC-type multidrug transport system permease subunit